MSIALLAARLTVFLVFAASGATKFADLDNTRRVLKNFGVGDALAAAGRWLLPTVELLVAALMLGATTAWVGSVGAVILLVLFSTAIAMNLSRGRRPECHCFGQLASEPISARTLWRNAVLAIPPLVVIIAGRNDAGPSAVTWLTDLRVGEQVLLAITTGLIIAVAILLEAHRRLGASVRILEALFDEHIERRATARKGAEAPSSGGLPIGAPVPQVTLLNLQGEAVGLARLFEGSDPTALLFVSGGCTACSEVLRDLDLANVVLIARGSPASNAELISKHPDLRILFDREAGAADAFRATWTPAAVLVTTDGHIASDTRFGKAAIEALLTGASVTPHRPAGDLTLGERVPAFSALDDHGQPVGHEVLSGARTALLYWSHTCGYCQAMEAELAQWADARPARAPRLVLLTAHTIPLPNRFGAAAVITDADGSIARAFGLVVTPAAVLTSAEGRITSAVGVGAEDVKALLGGFDRAH